MTIEIEAGPGVEIVRDGGGGGGSFFAFSSSSFKQQSGKASVL
jgi:hypothetical protein